MQLARVPPRQGGPGLIPLPSAEQQQQQQQQQQASEPPRQQEQATPQRTHLPGTAGMSGCEDLPLLPSASPFFLELPNPFLGATPGSGAQLRPASAGTGPLLQQQHMTAQRRSGLDAGAATTPALAQQAQQVQQASQQAKQQAQQAQQASQQAQQQAQQAQQQAQLRRVGSMSEQVEMKGAASGSLAPLPEEAAAGQPAAVAAMPQAQAAGPVAYIPSDTLTRMSLKASGRWPQHCVAFSVTLMHSSPVPHQRLLPATACAAGVQLHAG